MYHWDSKCHKIFIHIVGITLQIARGHGYYEFHEEKLTWQEARNACLADGGDLAPVPLNIELTKFDRIQILLEIHIAVLSRIVGLS